MKQSDEGGEFRWAAEFPKEEPQRFPIDRVECFDQVDEDCVEVYIIIYNI